MLCLLAAAAHLVVSIGMEASKKLKRRHHTVPRFHLLRFANERKQVIRVELPGDRRHLVSIDDASVERDFYLIEQEHGSKSDAVEELLGKFEDAAARGVRAVVDDLAWPIPDQVRQDIAGWAALQALRTTTQRQSGNEIADMLLKLQVGVGGKPQIRRLMREHLGREPTDAEVDQAWNGATDFDSYSIKAHRNEHLKIMLDLLPGTASMFYARGWTLIRFQRKALITCDNPVHLVPAPDHPRWSGIGLVTAAQIFVPLDRRMALLMGDTSDSDKGVPGTTAIAKRFNGALAWNSSHAIFHHPDDDPLIGIDLPDPGRRVTGGYEDVKGMAIAEGVAARFRASEIKEHDEPLL